MLRMHHMVEMLWLRYSTCKKLGTVHPKTDGGIFAWFMTVREKKILLINKILKGNYG